MDGPSQQRAFDLAKDELSKTPELALYDPERETTVSDDASSYGLGAVLRQRTNGTLRPVTYASRAMTPTEQRYSQIEEALATTWSLERFTDYLFFNGSMLSVQHWTHSAQPLWALGYDKATVSSKILQMFV